MENKIICGVYKITSPSGRIYIGQSVSITKRWADYKTLNSKTKNQPVLWKSLLKYGVENHIFEIIEECSEEDLNCSERYWQDFYDVLNGGLNCVLQECGEQRKVLSKEVREVLRLSNIGREVSSENKRKLSVRMKNNTYRLGKPRSGKEKTKISASMKLISQGSDNNMYGKFGQDNPNSKIILHPETGIFYFGIREASVAVCVPYTSLKKMMCGYRENKTSLIYV